MYRNLHNAHDMQKKKKKYKKKLKIFKCAFEKKGKSLFKFYFFNHIHKNFTMRKCF